ncbi:endocuticle structural glycoprotein SgAbd-4-like [Anoplophora glabripennis]|uniref:endocuticle structural glycoprotein SgAbd-4-like n=1 Tax=Anoplophora glabripennis TaxID=217634 RepID=UPI000875836B|nr:endocuticle structural glycoprotein SgAbd-4-like [Anoplophora glabripennis]
MMKLVLIYALMIAVASAVSPLALLRYPTKPPVLSPVPSYNVYAAQPGKVIAILRQESDISPDGSYQYAYDTENGISAQESGSLSGSGPDAAIAATGSYQYTAPDGTPVQISYVADQNGFQPAGNVLPTSPPVPEAILRSLAYIAAHPQSQGTSAPVKKYFK